MKVTCSSPRPVGIERCARVFLPPSALLACKDCRAVAVTTMAALLRQDRSSPPAPRPVAPDGRQAGGPPCFPTSQHRACKVDLAYQVRWSAFGMEVLHLSVLLPHPGPERPGPRHPMTAPLGTAAGPCGGCLVHAPSLADHDLVLTRALLPLPSDTPSGRAFRDAHASELARLFGLLADALLTCELPSPFAPETNGPSGNTPVVLDPDRLGTELRMLGQEASGSRLGWWKPELEAPFPCLDRMPPGTSSLSTEPMLLVSLKRRAPEPASVALARSSDGLTTREALVARLLSERRSNLEIAAALGISPHTARHHTEQVLIKLGLHSRGGVWARLHQPP